MDSCLAIDLTSSSNGDRNLHIQNAEGSDLHVLHHGKANRRGRRGGVRASLEEPLLGKTSVIQEAM